MSFFIRKNFTHLNVMDEFHGTEPFYFIYCGEIFLTQAFDDFWKNGRHDWYLLYMLNGSMEVTIDTETFQMAAGDVFVIPPETPFAYNNIKTRGEHIKYRFIHFVGTEIDKVLDTCNITTKKVFHVGFHEELVGLWDNLFKIVVSDAKKLDDNFGIILPYILMRISYFTEKKETRIKKFDKSIKYIHLNISEDISVEELAKMEFLSSSRYREVFKKITGFSPSDYINALRIRLACELFINSNSSIEDVAKAVGFSDRLYFQRFFKKHTGQTPGMYLKKHR